MFLFIRKYTSHKYSKKAFKKGGSAAFIVTSTYQLMCAIEAINEFSIKDVKIVLAFQKQMKTRNEQMMAEILKTGLEYDVIVIDNINFDAFLKFGYIKEINNKKRYERIYIGDYYHFELYMLAVEYAKPNAIVLFLDDGNSMIMLFTNHEKFYANSERWIDIYSKYEFNKKRKTHKKKILKKIKESGLVISNCFFTSYADINNNKYNTYANSFKYIKDSYEINEYKTNTVYIIGTIIDAYDKQISSLSKKDIENLTCEILSNIRKRHTGEKIIYIPHPRDNNEIVQKCCIDNKFEYVRPLTTVETFILESKLRPEAIIGFGSTALGTLRCMFPSTPIFNYIIQRDKNDIDKGHIAIYKYYKQKGINNIWINPPETTGGYKRISPIENTVDFLKTYLQTRNDKFTKFLSFFIKIKKYGIHVKKIFE